MLSRNIIAHPDIYMMKREKFGDIEEKVAHMICKSAEKYNIQVLYGIDAHYKGQIALWNELLELAHEILGEKIISKLNFIETDDF